MCVCVHVSSRTEFMSDHESAVYMSAWSIDFYHHDWLTCSIAQV